MDIQWITFPDGERQARSGATGDKALIVSDMRTADDFWKVSLMADALRGRGAKRVTLIAPYLGYARQDRRAQPGDAAGGPLLLRQLAAAGVTKLVTADLHGDYLRKPQPLSLVSADTWPLFAAALKKRLGRVPVTICAPDHGAVKRALAVAGRMKDASMAWVEKHRVGGARILTGRLRGRLLGETAVIVDDILSTGVTIEAAVKALRKAGIRRVWVAVTHAVFSDGAAKRLERAGVERLFVSDTLPKPKTRIRTERLSVGALLRKAAR
ncbi:MAG TPA: ribose-phosphate diphosphokinase [Patescibacteria group bacterium]|nr:ribose-phosphate diphosphokinase [Patescibacteria group bacterium]